MIFFVHVQILFHHCPWNPVKNKKNIYVHGIAKILLNCKNALFFVIWKLQVPFFFIVPSTGSNLGEQVLRTPCPKFRSPSSPFVVFKHLICMISKFDQVCNGTSPRTDSGKENSQDSVKFFFCIEHTTQDKQNYKKNILVLWLQICSSWHIFLYHIFLSK